MHCQDSNSLYSSRRKQPDYRRQKISYKLFFLKYVSILVLFFVYFRSRLKYNKIDTVLGIQTWGHRMVRTEGCTQLHMTAALQIALLLTGLLTIGLAITTCLVPTSIKNKGAKSVFCILRRPVCLSSSEDNGIELDRTLLPSLTPSLSKSHSLSL